MPLMDSKPCNDRFKQTLINKIKTLGHMLYLRVAKRRNKKLSLKSFLLIITNKEKNKIYSKPESSNN